jgi:hypothetical protein
LSVKASPDLLICTFDDLNDGRDAPIPGQPTAREADWRYHGVNVRTDSSAINGHKTPSVESFVNLTLELKLRGGQGVALAAVGRPAAPSASANRWAAGHRNQSASL